MGLLRLGKYGAAHGVVFGKGDYPGGSGVVARAVPRGEGESCVRGLWDRLSSRSGPVGKAVPGAFLFQMYSARSSRLGPGMVTAETSRPFLRTTAAAASTAARTSNTEPAIST